MCCRFAPVCASYLRRADAVVLAFDITKLSSFENVKKWADIAKVRTYVHTCTYCTLLNFC